MTDLTTQSVITHRGSGRPAVGNPFHLAIPVTNLQHARAFYGTLLACPEGRTSTRWTDYNFFGHQLTIHLSETSPARSGINPVDGDEIPVPHFGAVLSPAEFDSLAETLKQAKVPFLHEPRTRFAGKTGEQKTMFIHDPSGNILEFKSFADLEQLFARN